MRFEGFHCDAHGPNCKDRVENYVARLYMADVNEDGYAIRPGIDEGGHTVDAMVGNLRFDSCERGKNDAWAAARKELKRRRIRRADGGDKSVAKATGTDA